MKNKNQTEVVIFSIFNNEYKKMTGMVLRAAKVRQILKTKLRIS
jgi:hypothetical protein